MLKLKGNYFNGQYHTGKNADESLIKKCPGDLSEELWEANFYNSHVDEVISSAQSGYEIWRKTPLEKRIECIQKYKEQVIKNVDVIAKAIALDTGKPLWEARTEAGALSAKVDVTIAESLKRVSNIRIENILPNIDGHIIYKSLGPSLVIGPFNFPCHLANTQILGALLTGNSIIFKPSEKTIHSSQLMFDCFVEAGFPKGVINLINGSGAISSKLCLSRKIKAVFFTGSLPIGLKILEATHSHIEKVVALELGGKNTTILHSDTNIDHALPELLRSCFLSTGQRCTSTSLVAIHESIADKFIEKFKSITERVIIDHPTKYKIDPFMGPLIDGMALEKYNEICQQGEKEGAELIYKNNDLGISYQGHYCSPTIYKMDKSNIGGKYIQSEIFGPNCTFMTYKNIDEAIKIANCTDYGLAASVFTQNKDIYHQCITDIESGLINLNRSTVGASSRLPFGGVKSSGNGHPAAISMIDSTVHMISSLETTDESSSIDSVKGLK